MNYSFWPNGVCVRQNSIFPFLPLRRFLMHTYIQSSAISTQCGFYSDSSHDTFVTSVSGLWGREFSLNVCVFMYFRAFGRCHCCCYCSQRCACGVDRGRVYCCRCCSCSCCCCCHFIAFVPLLDIGQRYFDLYLLRFIIIAITDVRASPALHIAAI